MLVFKTIFIMNLILNNNKTAVAIMLQLLTFRFSLHRTLGLVGAVFFVLFENLKDKENKKICFYDLCT